MYQSVHLINTHNEFEISDLPIDLYAYDASLYNAYADVDLPDVAVNTNNDVVRASSEARLRLRRQVNTATEAPTVVSDNNDDDDDDAKPDDANNSSVDSADYEIDYELYQQYLDYLQNRDDNSDNVILEDEGKQGDSQAAESPTLVKVENTDSDVSGNDERNNTPETSNKPSDDTEKKANRRNDDDSTAAGGRRSDVISDGQPRRNTRRRKKQRTTTTPASQNDYIFNDNYANYYDSAADDVKEVDRVLYLFLPLIVLAVSGAVCYYFTRVACKLCMQEFSVSLPLTVATPMTAAIFCYLCHLRQWTRVGCVQRRD